MKPGLVDTSLWRRDVWGREADRPSRLFLLDQDGGERRAITPEGMVDCTVDAYDYFQYLHNLYVADGFR